MSPLRHGIRRASSPMRGGKGGACPVEGPRSCWLLNQVGNELSAATRRRALPWAGRYFLVLDKKVPKETSQRGGTSCGFPLWKPPCPSPLWGSGLMGWRNGDSWGGTTWNWLLGRLQVIGVFKIGIVTEPPTQWPKGRDQVGDAFAAGYARPSDLLPLRGNSLSTLRALSQWGGIFLSPLRHGIRRASSSMRGGKGGVR